VLTWLARDIDRERLGTLLQSADWRYVAAAFGLKLGSLVLHEVRTWMPLPRPRPPLSPLVRMCLGVGMLNLVFPGRAGDIGIIAALNRRFAVPVGTATAVVGVTSFIEAAVFGLILLAALGAALSGSGGVVDAGTLADLVPTVAAAAAASVAGVGVAVALGRWRASRPEPTGVAGVLHRTLVDTAALLTSPGELAANTGLALAQVGLLVAAFAAGLPAVGLHDLPAVATASQVLAISSLASVLLPPSWGVGPAAASRLVLTAAGHSAEEALVYAGVYWLIAHVPFLAIGLPSLWWQEGERG